MEDQEPSSSGETEQEVFEGSENEFGFKPMEEPILDESKKRKREESEESKTLKREILRYVARYPKLELRTSKQIMSRLDEMEEDELRIVRDNCVTDLSEIRGAPVASFAIFAITKPVDMSLPGYTEQCLQDVELKRDVETELINILGELGNRINIFFRLLNNAYITWKKRRGEYFDDAPTPIPKCNTESCRTTDRDLEDDEGRKEREVDEIFYSPGKS